ncbi:two-pore potassium channel 1-like [Tripterygium wilfordii]|uniref:Two-pore potassium channel 1-like n=2 Tax=Tripterygium wilfordii TaxID=458696 RepID=A0A7J7C8N3_TRIWF|nr:two-pore potassium channel 1-like isoform X2 [Tripterygium wilfordii]KAF5730482.1 two-pore potassium channel 1-like [Tripterygium wilfordii]
MASNEANQPLLSTLVDLTPRKGNKVVPKRRRFRRCRSAPVADLLPQDNNGKGPIPRSEYIFGKFHPNFKLTALCSAVYLVIGTICFYFVRDEITGMKTDALLDAVYFTIVTMTTVGYGDLVPDSVLSKLLACGFVFSGMAIVGMLLSKAADNLVEKQEILLFKAMYKHEKVDQSEMLEDIEFSKVKYKTIFTSILMLVFIIVGTIFLVFVEGLSFVDAFYCVCSTVTTLGYGDQSFSTKGGRVFAVFWILGSTICVALFYLYVAELATENRQRALVNWVLTRKTTNTDLEAADIDDDGIVGAAEFIIYKLKEMGKISQADISVLLEEFEDLDVDQSGTLSVSDIILAQMPQTER